MLQEGVFPENFEKSNVVPVYKKKILRILQKIID